MVICFYLCESSKMLQCVRQWCQTDVYWLFPFCSWDKNMCKLYFNIFQKQKITPSNISNSKNKEKESIFLVFFFIIYKPQILKLLGGCVHIMDINRRNWATFLRSSIKKRFKYFSQSLHLWFGQHFCWTSSWDVETRHIHTRDELGYGRGPAEVKAGI